jgi:hypothetical protein
MAPSSRGNDDLEGRHVCVALARGHNFSGVVRREYQDSHGRRRIEVEDTRGEPRDVALWRPSVSVDIDDGDSGAGLQDLLREADRRERRNELGDDGGQSA